MCRGVSKEVVRICVGFSDTYITKLLQSNRRIILKRPYDRNYMSQQNQQRIFHLPEV